MATDLAEKSGDVTERRVIFDACCLINVYASGFFQSILGSFKIQSCLVEQVNEESLFIRKPTGSSSKYEYEPIELDSYIQNDQLKLVKLETEIEMALFVRLAERLDDGEAATIALAIERKMDVVTDDKKAIQTLKEEASSVEILTTLDIIKIWCESARINRDDVKLALGNIRICANYQPSKNHDLFQWWESQVV